MIEIWTKSTRFNETTQKPTDQARWILKKGWPQMLEMSEQINGEEYEQVPPVRIETQDAKKQDPPTRIKIAKY